MVFGVQNAAYPDVRDCQLLGQTGNQDAGPHDWHSFVYVGVDHRRGVNLGPAISVRPC